MNYTDLLSKDEQTALCKMITGRNFKGYFEKNEKTFSKMKRGFRAKSLSNEDALNIAVEKINEPFISSWINEGVAFHLKNIGKDVERFEKEGLDHDCALAKALTLSFFAGNVGLYLKLSGNNSDADYAALLAKKMEEIEAKHIKEIEADERIKKVEEEKNRLQEQIKDGLTQMEAAKEAYEQRLQEVEHEKKLLEEKLAEAQEKIAELQSADAVDESADIDYLEQFDDTDPSAFTSVGNDELVSLCEVFTHTDGKKYLRRYADLSRDGRYCTFQQDEDLPRNFKNRDRIYYKDGPSGDGFYGIWSWTANPSEKDPATDYVISRFIDRLPAIEVVVLDVSNLDEMAALLKSGIERKLHSEKTMFAFSPKKGQYVGVLCNSENLVTAAGKIKLAEDCNEIPVYVFSGLVVLYLKNKLCFFKKAFAGRPDKLYPVKELPEIVKDIFLSSLSWNACKARGITRSAYKAFKEFIDVVPTDDVIVKIGKACHCSEAKAKQLLAEFMNTAGKYIDGSSLEDGVIQSAASFNSELREQMKDLVRADWEKENESLLTETREKLDAEKTNLKSIEESLEAVQARLAEAKAEDERLSDAIAAKEKLAEDVEAAVADRIQKARSNAAEFIGNMAFVGGQPVPNTFDAVGNGADIGSMPYRVIPQSEDFDNLEAHHSWADVFYTVEVELREAGCSENRLKGLAAFLCAAYINNQPILLAGPNAIDIAQAFIAAVTGHQCGVLTCDGKYNERIVESIGAAGEKIGVINNLFASEWMNRLPEVLSKKDIFFIITHPYAEDIPVEPKSLFGYLVPLFTEFFVDKKARGNYYGGYFAPDFEEYKAKENSGRKLKALSKLSLTPLTQNRIETIAGTMHDIFPDATTDDDFMLGILPMAYALMKIDNLAEMISNQQVAVSESLKRDLRYILGEV